MTEAISHRYRALDSLRGIAALVVVLWHMILLLPGNASAAFGIAGLAARCAVLLFFVLSGFVLSLPFFSWGPGQYAPFAVRRALRLYPPFAFAVIVSAVLCTLIGGKPLSGVSDWANSHWSSPVTGSILAAHLLMTGVHQFSTRLDGPIWSLIVEMRVSLLFPVLVFYARRFGWIGLIASIGAAFVSAKLRAGMTETGLFSPMVAESAAGAVLLTLEYVPFFLFGIMLASRLDQTRAVLVRARPALHLTVLGVVVAGVVIFSATVGGHGIYVDTVGGLLAAYAIALAVTFNGIARPLLIAPMLWLGDISYSLYLIHVPILLAVAYLFVGRVPMVAVLAISAPAILLTSALMQWLVERPSTALGRKLARAMTRPATRPMAAPT